MSSQIPDFPHRAALREISQQVTEQRVVLDNVINQLTIHLNGGDAVMALSAEWLDLAPVPARLRILAQLPVLGAGAFVGEVEYEDGAEIDDVVVAEAVRGLVLVGTFFLRAHAHDEEHRRYDAGDTFFLDYGLKHGWRVEGRTRSLLVFTPPAPAPEPEKEYSGCAVTPDLV